MQVLVLDARTTVSGAVLVAVLVAVGDVVLLVTAVLRRGSPR